MPERRTLVSAALVVAGTALFWWAMATPAVDMEVSKPPLRTLPTHSRLEPRELHGWSLAFTAPTLSALVLACALAPFGWMGAAWFRSPWSRIVSAILIGVSALVVIGLPRITRPEQFCMAAFPSSTVPGNTEFVAGWWRWALASLLLAASFVVLPAPERPPVGEDLPPEVVRAARSRVACVTAIVALCVAVVLSNAIVPYGGSWMPREIRLQHTALRPPPPRSVLVCMARDAGLWFPLLYAAAPLTFFAALRWRSLRVGSALVAAGAICAMLLVREDGYWDPRPVDPVPLFLVVWYLVPGSFFLASWLLPPGRGEASPDVA